MAKNQEGFGIVPSMRKCTISLRTNQDAAQTTAESQNILTKKKFKLSFMSRIQLGLHAAISLGKIIIKTIQPSLSLKNLRQQAFGYSYTQETWTPRCLTLRLNSTSSGLGGR